MKRCGLTMPGFNSRMRHASANVRSASAECDVRRVVESRSTEGATTMTTITPSNTHAVTDASFVALVIKRSSTACPDRQCRTPKCTERVSWDPAERPRHEHHSAVPPEQNCLQLNDGKGQCQEQKGGWHITTQVGHLASRVAPRASAADRLVSCLADQVPVRRSDSVPTTVSETTPS